MNNKLIFTSYGLTSKTGRKLIHKALRGYNLTDKKIFLFHEPHEFLVSKLIEVCLELGFRKENIIVSGEQENNQEVVECDCFYCTEGNTFEVLSLLRKNGIDQAIKKAFELGDKIYIGCSAGAMIAGISIEVAKDFDKNFVRMTDFKGLELFDGIIIPHYSKSDLKRYISNSPGIEAKYKQILSVSNEKCVVLEV